LISSCSTKQKYSVVKIKSKEDSVSYFLGLTYGSQLKQANIDSVFQYQAFVKGLTEAIEEDTMPVSRFMIQTYLSGFFKEFQEKQLRNQFKDYITQNKGFLETNAKKDSVVKLPSGLQYIILKEGKGEKPTMNDRIKVHYIGSLIDGTIFDSSFKRNQPAEFHVGQVIPGWTEAMQLMPVGSKWKVFIPENLAYGAQPPQGSGIQPFSTLIFEVELLDILPNEIQK
jgi:FKBP-type peptidyl-prolyl cis-trans isomerase FklB